MHRNVATGSIYEGALAFLSGGGEMGGLIASMDWSATPLGPIESWAPSLRAAVSLSLASNIPMSVLWGPRGVQLYNDSYRPLCGSKHPGSMGQPYKDCWASMWDALGRPFARALEGQAAWVENRRLRVERNGCVQEVPFRFALSPIRDETGVVVGVLHAALEIAPAGAELPRSDLASRGRAEEALRQTREELEATQARLRAEIAERKRAESAQTELLRQLARAQEDERRRVARDLHDSVGQVVTGLSLSFKALATGSDLPSVSAARLAEAKRVVDALAREVHHLAVQLRPASLDELGLEAAIQDLVNAWSSRTGVRAECAISLWRARLTPEIETALYRVVQEALTNVAKHAGAKVVSVVFTRADGYVTAVVEDDGVGFQPEAAAPDRLGLLGMRERANLVGGELDIESKPGWGTTVLIRIPIPTERLDYTAGQH